MSPRPLAITVVCGLGAIAAVVTAALFALNGVWAVPPTGGQRLLALALVALTAAALVGLWRMRRWGVLVLALLLAARILYGLAAQAPWNLPALAGPALMLAVGLVYLPRMR